jgi:hypothetical protein
MNLTINMDILKKSVSAEVKRLSFGLAPVEVQGIEAIGENGETFPIVGIRVTTASPAAQAAASRPVPRGKLRLVALHGEAL